MIFIKWIASSRGEKQDLNHTCLHLNQILTMKLERPQKSVDIIMQCFEGFFYLQATVKLEFQRSQSFLSKIIFSFQWQLQASASLFTLRIKHWKYFSLQATTYYLTQSYIYWTIWYQVRVAEVLPSNAHARKIFMCAPLVDENRNALIITAKLIHF